jgi:hypothetical protein
MIQEAENKKGHQMNSPTAGVAPSRAASYAISPRIKSTLPQSHEKKNSNIPATGADPFDVTQGNEFLLRRLVGHFVLHVECVDGQDQAEDGKSCRSRWRRRCHSWSLCLFSKLQFWVGGRGSQGVVGEAIERNVRLYVVLGLECVFETPKRGV